MVENMYGIQIIGEGDQPIMLDHRGIVQSWFDTVVENVGSNSPIVIKFYLSEDVRYVRQLRLNLSFENFRAYDRSADNFGGDLTSVPSESHWHGLEIDIESALTGDSTATRTESGNTSLESGHSHSFSTTYRLAYSHNHPVSGPGVSWESTESHSHDTTAHDHPMEQGIWEGSAMEPESVTVKLNNVDIEKTFENTVENIKLPKDELVYGWNTIEVSSSSLGRISASYFIQVFMSVL